MARGSIADVSTAAGPVRAGEPPGRVPALTIASHASAHRVGERVVLEALAAGREVEVSRNAPDFARPDRALGAPLDDPFVSRRPIRLVPLGGGGIRVVVGAGGTPVAIGAEVGDHVELAAEDVARGVLIELAGRVVLLLHLLDRAVADGADRLGMVGDGAGIRRVRAAVERVADLAVPVLIRGETGTGKELVARSTTAVRVAVGRSSASTSARSRASSRRRSCSARPAAPTPARPATATACSAPRTAGRCSSTRPARRRPRSRSCCSACSRPARSARSAPTGRSRSRFA